jgi:predicted ester cyclase
MPAVDPAREQNEQLIRRFFEEVYNMGHYAFAGSVVAADCRSHNRLGFEVLGPEGIKKAAKAQRDAFPDQHTTILDMIAEGDKVVVRGRDTGTFTHPFMGREPSGTRIDIT